ncbi:Pycsar system effector family protein [Mycolicibacterium arabiense]|uniref:Pycsar system effector family protein n=1 Tax=Mycolicibacterium arabiense TaxID=1286181 RepID=UPI0021F3A9C9
MDAKASFALAVESALLAGVVTLSGKDRALDGVSGWALIWYVVGVILLIAAVLCCVWTVRPRLRSSKLEFEAPVNFIYFGHLRLRTQDEVSEHLRDSDLVPVLSRQLVEMSKIAWTKHRLVQISLTFAPLGVACLAVAATYQQASGCSPS